MKRVLSIENTHLLSYMELLWITEDEFCQPEFVYELLERRKMNVDLKINLIKYYNLRTHKWSVEEHDLNFIGTEAIIVEVMCQSNFSIININ